MKIRRVLQTNYRLWLVLIAILITCGVLFIKPEVGVADQGDFDRVMGISGLTLLESDTNNPSFIRFYDYIVPEYKIIPIDKGEDDVVGFSLSYLIIFINNICKYSGQTIFKTQYLAIFYCIIYVFAFSVIIESLNIKDKNKFMLVSILILLVFFDGNYLIWFNSLYGEPMMITTMSLFFAAVFNYINYKYVIMETKNITYNIVYIILTAFLFLGSKLQVSTSLPLILLIVIKIIWDNKYILNKISFVSLCISAYILLVYPIGICLSSDNLSKDTEYNSVFYGILNGSATPEQDLKDLGLNPDMAVEAKKHSYLDYDEYVKYIPGSELTNEEFYSKISNLKLAKFYLTHPKRLLAGMNYTASEAFHTSTFLGKCSQDYSEIPVREFHRFTLWSYIREHVLPGNLLFIILVYTTIILFSFRKYIKSKADLATRNKILLLWIIMLIGAAQFPMPFVGNGRADTAKQLFLFNFIFDGLLLLILYYAFGKIIRLIEIVSKKINTK